MPKLTPEQETALEALVATATVAEAAASLGVTTADLRRRLREDETLFAAWRLASRVLAEESFAALVKGGGRFAQVLVDIAEGRLPGRDGATRLRACEAAFELVEDYLSRIDLAERVERLEAILAGKAGAA